MMSPNVELGRNAQSWLARLWWCIERGAHHSLEFFLWIPFSHLHWHMGWHRTGTQCVLNELVDYLPLPPYTPQDPIFFSIIFSGIYVFMSLFPIRLQTMRSFKDAEDGVRDSLLPSCWFWHLLLILFSSIMSSCPKSASFLKTGSSALFWLDTPSVIPPALTVSTLTLTEALPSRQQGRKLKVCKGA